MNKTSCCQQVLCTKCFVNLRRPPSGRTISCPFCNRRDFSVEYRSPMQLLEEDAGVTSHNRPSPVKCEQIRVHRPPPSAPPSAAYRAATTRYYGYNGPPFTVRSGSRAATYGGGVLILYNERGEPIYVPEPPRSTRTAPYGAPLPSNRNNPYRSQYRTSYRDPYGYLANSYRYAY